MATQEIVSELRNLRSDISTGFHQLSSDLHNSSNTMSGARPLPPSADLSRHFAHTTPQSDLASANMPQMAWRSVAPTGFLNPPTYMSSPEYQEVVKQATSTRIREGAIGFGAGMMGSGVPAALGIGGLLALPLAPFLIPASIITGASLGGAADNIKRGVEYRNIFRNVGSDIVRGSAFSSGTSGVGFSESQVSGLANQMRYIEDRPTGFYKKGEAMQMMATGARIGLFEGVSTPKKLIEMINKFEEPMQQIARGFKVGIEDATKIMNEFMKNAPDPDTALRNINIASGNALAFGVTSGQTISAVRGATQYALSNNQDLGLASGLASSGIGLTQYAVTSGSISNRQALSRFGGAAGLNQAFNQSTQSFYEQPWVLQGLINPEFYKSSDDEKQRMITSGDLLDKGYIDRGNLSDVMERGGRSYGRMDAKDITFNNLAMKAAAEQLGKYSPNALRRAQYDFTMGQAQKVLGPDVDRYTAFTHFGNVRKDMLPQYFQQYDEMGKAEEESAKASRYEFLMRDRKGSRWFSKFLPWRSEMYKPFGQWVETQALHGGEGVKPLTDEGFKEKFKGMDFLLTGQAPSIEELAINDSATKTTMEGIYGKETVAFMGNKWGQMMGDHRRPASSWMSQFEGESLSRMRGGRWKGILPGLGEDLGSVFRNASKVKTSSSFSEFKDIMTQMGKATSQNELLNLQRQLGGLGIDMGTTGKLFEEASNDKEAFGRRVADLGMIQSMSEVKDTGTATTAGYLKLAKRLKSGDSFGSVLDELGNIKYGDKQNYTLAGEGKFGKVNKMLGLFTEDTESQAHWRAAYLGYAAKGGHFGGESAGHIAKIFELSREAYEAETDPKKREIIRSRAMETYNKIQQKTGLFDPKLIGAADIGSYVSGKGDTAGMTSKIAEGIDSVVIRQQAIDEGDDAGGESGYGKDLVETLKKLNTTLDTTNNRLSTEFKVTIAHIDPKAGDALRDIVT